MGSIWLDIFLLPKRLYKRMNDKKLTLFFGILFVGAADLIFIIADNYTKLFTGRPQAQVAYNTSLSIAYVILLGLIDVLFFTFPLFDLFKLFKKDGELPDKETLLTKMMKVYTGVHLLIIPINVLFYFIMKSKGTEVVDTTVALIYIYFVYIMPFWFSAAITRGMNAIYNFRPLFKMLAFGAIYLWNILLGYAFVYIINHWMLRFLNLW